MLLALTAKNMMTAATKSNTVLSELERSPKLPERNPPVASMTVSKAPARIPLLAADSLVVVPDISNIQDEITTQKPFCQ